MTGSHLCDPTVKSFSSQRLKVLTYFINHLDESQQTKENVPQKICKATFKAKFKMPSAPKDFNDTWSLDWTDNELSPDLEEEQCKDLELFKLIKLFYMHFVL